MKKGIKLLLEPGTRVRDWIRYQTLNVRVRRERLKGRIIRSLEIRGGEASFFPGGGVEVKMPGSAEFRCAFQPMKVLEIHDLRGKLIKRNHHLCTECATLTGKMESHKPSTVIAGRMDATFKCTQCGHQYELERI
jgi:hypothetical protein